MHEALDLVPDAPVVLDPVMVSESGAQLLAPDARRALVDLLPRATVVTPNLLEARALLEEAGRDRAGRSRPRWRARSWRSARGTSWSRAGTPPTRTRSTTSATASASCRSRARAIPDGAAHGSGCTHSSALAAHLALGLPPLEAAVAAKVVASEAVRDGLQDIGAGPARSTRWAWQRGPRRGERARTPLA